MKLRALAGIAGFLLASTAAHATIIGVAVESIGSNNQVGSTNGDGSINFYIPLSADASGTYGVDAGTSVDSCYFPYSCKNGTLDMFLRFDTGWTGSAELVLGFLDLDLAGVNDPWNFLESVVVNDGTNSTVFDSKSDASWANSTAQLLSIGVNVLSDPFFVQLAFASTFDPFSSYGKYYNTQETMIAALQPVSVPEPTTLSLLGAGLVAVGFAGRRRKTAKAA